MTPLLAFAVGSGPILVAGIIDTIIAIRKDRNANWYWSAVLYAILSVAGFSMPFAWKTNIYFGLALAVSLYAYMIYGILWSADREDPEIVKNIVFVLFLLIFILMATAVPVSVLPQLRSGTVVASAAPPSTDSLSTTELENRFDELTESMNDQRKRVESTMHTLQEQMSRQGDEMRRLRRSRQELLNEIKTYKRMAQVSEGEAEAIRRVLMKDKHIDYLFGFLIGIASSGAVALVSKLSAGHRQ